MAGPISLNELNGVFNNTTLPFDWSGRLVGGATRPDAMKNTNPALLTAMQRMILAAPPGVSENIGLTSAYRSPERQAELYNAAVAKGTHRTPGHQVAPPGRSNHNHGEAVDMAWAGGGYRNAPREAVDWVYQNADKFGLTLPVRGETWHVELANGRRNASPPPSGGGAGGTVMAAGSQPRGLLDRLTVSSQGAPAAAPDQRTWMQRTLGDPEWRMRLGATLDGMTLNPNQALQANVAGKLKERADEKAKNKTAEWLQANGRPDLAEAVASGALSGSEAAQVFYRPPEQPDTTALMQNVEYLMAQGMTLPDAIKAAGSGGDTVFNNRTDPAPASGYKNVYNPDGSLSHQEPIKGGPAEAELAAQAAKAKADADAAAAAAANAGTLQDKQDRYTNSTVEAIDTLLGSKDQGTRGIIDGSGGMFDWLPETGIVGARLARWGLSQEAASVGLTLETVKSSVAFDRLQLMRDMSKTGGALGGVSEKELSLLQSALGSLDQNLDPPLLKKNLQYIRDTMAKIEKDPIARQVYYGGGAGGAGAGDGFSVVNP